MNLKQLVKEALENKGCCTATKPTKAPILNENKAPRNILSEGLKYHIDNNKPLTEHVYRAGSTKYFNLWAEARDLYLREILDFSGDDLDIITETDLGHFGIYEGQKVPLDFIMEEIEFPFEYKGFQYSVEDTGGMVNDKGQKLWKVSIQDKNGNVETTTVRGSSDREGHYEAKKFIEDELLPYYGLDEAKKAKKKNPPLNKPHRGGSKKFYVYVRKPGGGIKKVSFGDTTGLSAKINNPKARQAFSKRHNCPQKNDKTKASYWSCRLPRYSKLLGLKSSFSGFW